MERTEMPMIRWMCGVSLNERRPIIEPMRHLGVEAIGDVMGRGRLRCQGHVKRNDDADYVMACTRLVVERTALSAGRGRPGRALTAADMRLLKVDPETSTTEIQ